MVKSLQNEKAVFYAQIEARDGKLAQIPTLHDEIRNLKERVEHTEATEKDLVCFSTFEISVFDFSALMAIIDSLRNNSDAFRTGGNIWKVRRG